MRKRVIFSPCAASIVLLLLSGCASIEKQGSENGALLQQSDDGELAPHFYVDRPPPDTHVYGVGVAQLTEERASRRQAITGAENDIVSQLTELFHRAMGDYARDMGVESSAQIMRFTEMHAAPIAELVSKRNRVEQIAVLNSGKTFALVSLRKEILIEAVQKALTENAQEAFAEFRVSYAMEYFNSMLENDPPRSGGN